jgi:rhamnosyltransferase
MSLSDIYSHTSSSIVALVVLYKPSKECYNHILTYINSIDMLYIIDNSPSPSLLLQKLKIHKNTTILSTNENLGIAKAYNIALAEASSESYQWLMTMDQDSFFRDSDIDIFIEYFLKTDTKALAIYSPLHNKKFISKGIDLEPETVMSSGNIVSISKALSIEGFDERLFIDEVDHDFCMRLKLHNYKIIQNQRIAISHHLGTTIQNSPHKKYSATRLYYMARNYLYIYHKHKTNYPSFFKNRSKYLLKFFIKQIIFQSNKYKRIKMIGLGIKDYYIKRMGYTYEF